MDRKHNTTHIHSDGKSGIEVINANLSRRMRDEGCSLVRELQSTEKRVEGHERYVQTLSWTKAENSCKGKRHDGVCGRGGSAMWAEVIDRRRGRQPARRVEGFFVNDFWEHRFASHQQPDLLWLGWSPLSWRLAKQVWHFSVCSSLYLRDENECGPRINTQPYWQKINTFPLCLASVQQAVTYQSTHEHILH